MKFQSIGESDMQGHRTIKIKTSICHEKTALALSFVLIASLLSGCSLLQKFGILSEPASVPLSSQVYEIHLKLTASADSNPDVKSRPSPIQVRVFIADPQSAIATKSFEEIFDYAGTTMEPRPLATITLRPGQTKDLVLPANKTQTQLVIAAAYRDPYQALWIAQAVVAPEDIVSASATIGSTIVTINPTP